MARLLQLCSKEAETAPQMWNGQTASDLVSHVIVYVEWWLKNGRLDAHGLGSCYKDEVRCFDARPDLRATAPGFRAASVCMIASNSWLTELNGPRFEGFGREHWAIYAKVVAASTEPANLPSLLALSDEDRAQARDVLRRHVRSPCAPTPGQVL